LENKKFFSSKGRASNLLKKRRHDRSCPSSTTRVKRKHSAVAEKIEAIGQTTNEVQEGRGAV